MVIRTIWQQLKAEHTLKENDEQRRLKEQCYQRYVGVYVCMAFTTRQATYTRKRLLYSTSRRTRRLLLTESKQTAKPSLRIWYRNRPCSEFAEYEHFVPTTVEQRCLHTNVLLFWFVVSALLFTHEFFSVSLSFCCQRRISKRKRLISIINSLATLQVPS